MDSPHAFEMVDGIARLRIVGSYHFEAATGLVTSALAQAFDQRHSRLLVVATEVVGFASPSIAARHPIPTASGWSARTARMNGLPRNPRPPPLARVSA